MNYTHACTGNTELTVKPSTLDVNSWLSDWYFEVFLRFFEYFCCVINRGLKMKITVLKCGAKQVLFKVFQECIAGHHAGQLLSNLDNIYGRTAKLTGVSESTIRRIVNEGMEKGRKFETPGMHRKGCPKKEIDGFDLCAIRQKVHFFYTVKKEVPTLRKLLATVTEELNFGGSHELLKQI